ncbi:hypothetical protein S101468_00626 [Acetobacter pasteurianus subsp. pasteurianus]|uniref:Uncharacterized protein n=1 Tax=Acetobacter pasteurianus subsp. pasteurianus TaxID=481145 RepID=A0AAC9SQV1_ACEPA|nr:hypothetical protein S101468_00626 [Acetobacter pasteurianus subsp. pasteurianus]
MYNPSVRFPRRAWLVPEAVHEPVQGPAQNRRLFHVHQRSRRLLCHSRRESGQVLHDGLALRKRPLFLGSRRFVVSPDVCAIQKSHSECHSLLFLNQCEQPLPYAELRPADEKLRSPPPRTQFSGDTPPFRAILMTPENRCYRPPQIMWRRLAPRANLLNQRFPDRPCLVRKGACSVSFFHPYNMGRNSRSNRP